jgi:hypothetical protein
MKVLDLGEPDVRLEGLKLWIHGRQFPDLTDYWDGNWLIVTVEYSSNEAIVRTNGPILHLSDLSGWLEKLRDLNRELKGEANLEPIEPMISVKLKAELLGHILVNVSITPDVLHEGHWFEFEVDQSYLPMLISSLESVHEKFPVRGKP